MSKFHREVDVFRASRRATLACTALTLLFAVHVSVIVAAETPVGTPAVASQVKELFRVRCLECHGDKNARGGVKTFDYDLLLRKKKIVPGKPDESRLYQFLTATDETVMPPPEKPRLRPEDIDLVRRWIVAEAPRLPADVDAPTEANKDAGLQAVAGVD